MSSYLLKKLELRRAALALLLTLLTMSAQTTWADGLLTGSGTEDDPWVINNADDWTTFTGSNTYWASGKYVRLNADLTITSSAGTGTSNRFKGTFDGWGHTLTLNMTYNGGNDAFIAPFMFVDGATIKRLRTAGTITTNGKLCAGIIGDSHGTTLIKSCWSSVTISTSISGDGTHGGLVGRVETGSLTITDCLFDGSITGSDTHSCGGFVGWKHDDASLYFNHCLQAGDLTGITSTGGATFNRNKNNNASGYVNYTTCYYKTAYGTAQGTQTDDTGYALKNHLGDGWTVSGDNAVPIITVNTKDLSEAIISGVKPHYKHTGNEISVTCTVKDAASNTLTENTDYTVATSPTTVQDVGDYTLTITAKEGNAAGYIGSKSVSFKVLPWAEDAIAGGYCGDPAVNNGKNVYYEITDTGSDLTLTISGTGAMVDYIDIAYFPWYNYRSNIKHVVINNGVTTIGKYAFKGFNNASFTSVNIPASVTTIKDFAFEDCDKLESVNFDANSQLTNIGRSAFNSCSKLESINIPNSVTTIGNYAFYDCDELSSVYIGSGVSTIGMAAFSDCNALTTITVDGNNTAFKVDNKGVLFSFDDKTLVVYPKGLTATEYTIPNGVTTIYGYAFYYCDDLETITIPASVTTIGEKAFTGTTWFDNQDYDADGVLYINNIAFASSGVSGALTIKSGTTAIGNSCFSNNNDLTSVTIPASVTSIDEEAFNYCSNLMTVNIEANSQLTTIGKYAFYNCDKLNSIVIPASVTSIEYGAFDDCDGLESLTFEDGSQLTYIGESAFDDCNITTITFPASLTAIGDYAFEDCTHLKDVTFEAGSQLTSIGKEAFYCCENLISINIPAGVTSIGEDAFKYCTSMKDIYCYANPTNLTWDDGGCNDFKNYRNTVCHVEKASDWISFVPKVNVTFAGGYCGNPATNDGKNLRWDYAIDDNDNKTLKIFKNPNAEGNDFSMADNVDFGSNDFQDIFIEEGVTSIGANAFYQFTEITSVTIPASVTSIGASAFEDCDGLNNILVLATTPPTLGIGTFTDIDNSAVFTVRNSAYVSAEGWADVKGNTDQYDGCNFKMNPLDENFKQIAYIDENGQSATSPLAFPITSSDLDVVFNHSGDSWYYVSGTVVIDGILSFAFSTGSTNLILCDNATLTVKNIYAKNNLNIYQQEKDKAIGAMTVTISDEDSKSVVSETGITINGGNITINNTGDDSYGIYAENGEITINDGTIEVSSDSEGIYASDGNLTINGGTITVSDADYGIDSGGDYITVNGGTITVNDCEGEGFYASYNIRINDGDITISNTGNSNTGKGLYTSNEDIIIKGGKITIDNTEYGLYSSNEDIIIKGGQITIDNTEYGLYTSDEESNINISGGTVSIDNTEYGLYAYEEESNINISGGTVSIDNVDYGIYTEDEYSDINISGGTVSIDNASCYGIYTDDDDSEINIKNAEVTIDNASQYGIYCYEGNITIDNATVEVTVSSDNSNTYAIYAADEDIIIKNSTVKASATTTGDNKDAYGFYAYDDITITDATVTVTAENNSNDCIGMYARYGDVTINNGNVVVNGGHFGIITNNNIVINGGKVVANVADNDGYGMDGDYGISLGYTSFGDYIFAGGQGYYGTVDIKTDQEFSYDNGNGGFNTIFGVDVDKTAIAGKYLFPVIDEINLKANNDGNDSYWTTFYTSPRGYKINNNENADAYTATISGSSLILHKLGKVIPAGTAVIIVGEDNNISMTASAEEAEEPSALTGNELQGVDVVTATPENCYTLSRGSDGTGPIGFYKYNGTTVAANKAYLIYTGSSLARGYIDFGEEDLTGIEAPTTVSDVEDGEVYDLMGRRVIGKPNKKGIYVRNGKKFIVK